MDEREDWNADYCVDTGMSATCPKCKSDDVEQDIKPSTQQSRFHCQTCDYKGEYA